MVIIIYNIAAEFGGAKSILDYYYSKAINDSNNTFVFITGKLSYKKLNNHTTLNFPWVKKSIFYRLYFELFYIRNILRKFKPNKIISLQNLGVFFFNYLIQDIYIHNAISLYGYKFNIFLEPTLWFYKNIYPFFLGFFIKRCCKIIVQTNSIKNRLVSLYPKCSSKIIVEFPLIQTENIYADFDSNRFYIDNFTCFYPANCLSFKNHLLIINSLIQLLKVHKTKLNFIFTFDKNDNYLSKKISRQVSKYNLNVRFVGKLSRSQTHYLLAHTTLVFPSLIETLGLPLIEAKNYNSNILAINLDYSKEFLTEYSKLLYFDNNVPSLTNALKTLENTILNGIKPLNS